jgi:hypothetical protein
MSSACYLNTRAQQYDGHAEQAQYEQAYFEGRLSEGLQQAQFQLAAPRLRALHRRSSDMRLSYHRQVDDSAKYHASVYRADAAATAALAHKLQQLLLSSGDDSLITEACTLQEHQQLREHTQRRLQQAAAQGVKADAIDYSLMLQMLKLILCLCTTVSSLLW